MNQREALRRLAESLVEESEAIRHQAHAARQRIKAMEEVCRWQTRLADLLGGDDEALRLRQRATMTDREIATLHKEAERYDVEAERARNQAVTTAHQDQALEAAERNQFSHR